MTKAIPSALLAHYQSGCTTTCTCWKATLRNGSVYGFTDLDVDLIVDGMVYTAKAGYRASAVDTSAEMNPDNLEITGFLSGLSIAADDLRTGRWDYAAIEIFEVNYNDVTMGKNILRSGTLGEVKAGDVKFTAELRGLMQAYTRTVGRLTSKECDADFGDSRCKINAALWTVSGRVTTDTNRRVFLDSSLTQVNEWFTGGKVTWTSGLNVGLSMEVKQYTVGVVALVQQMPYDIGTGDTYTIVVGCTKRFDEDCVAKFNNARNFRGFPDLPGHDAYQVGKGSNATTTSIPTGDTGGAGTPMTTGAGV